MKLTPARWSAYLRQPDPTFGLVLVYGPDRGLVRERSDQLAERILGGDADPFRSSEFTASQLRTAPQALADEALAFGLVPGRRLLRVRDAADSIVEAVRLLLNHDTWPGFVLLEAGDLSKRSSLRELIEGARHAAAVPCYEDDPATLRQVVAETLKAAGLRPPPEVTEFLAQHLGNDRAITRSELEKLVLFMGPVAPGQTRTLTLDDVAVIVGDARAIALGGVAMAVGSGDRAAAVRAIAEAVAEGLEPIGLLRMVAAHLQRLYLAVGAVASGRPVKDAVAGLRPPVFFRDLEAFSRQVHLWSAASLEAALLIILETEMRCKQTGEPQRLLAEQACLRGVDLSRAHRQAAPRS